MVTKITGLSKNNVSALRETIPNGAEYTATTATFEADPAAALSVVESTIASLPGRGHPRASLYAVARKIKAQL